MPLTRGRTFNSIPMHGDHTQSVARNVDSNQDQGGNMDQEYKGSVLVVDDDRNIVSSVSRMMARAQFKVYPAESGEQALEIISKQPVDVVLMDINMSGKSGLEVLKIIKGRGFPCEVIIMTGMASREKALEAERKGAFDFLQKPFAEPEKVRIAVERASEMVHLQQERERLKQQVGANPDFDGFVGRSALMQTLYTVIRSCASVSAPVIVTGESGVGKELVAQAIHKMSDRSDKPFVAVNAAGIDPNLFRSEIFGHDKGSFTGADKDKAGFFEKANGGTLFLDEIAELPLDIQTSLLRVLEDGIVQRVGGSEVKVQVRLIVATNKDLKGEVQAGRFKHDLYNRLKVLRAEVPPLRERREDIPSLAQYLLLKCAKLDKKPMCEISAEAMQLLQHCSWRDGNVRQLRNAIQYALAMGTGKVLLPEHLPQEVVNDQVEPTQSVPTAYPYVPELAARPYQEAKKEAEIHFARYYFSEVLKTTNGVINQAAPKVGMEAPNLRKKLKEINLDASQFHTSGTSQDDVLPER